MKQYKLLGPDGKQYLSETPGTLGGNGKLKIYGRLDCPSALSTIRRFPGSYEKSRVFFADEKTALAAGFRPCGNCLREKYPGIHLHISSGNSIFVLEQLEKGLIDFGLLYTPVDPAKYESVEIPCRDPWGVLMRKDTPLAEKPFIRPEDLWDKPLIFSVQEDAGSALSRWIKRDREKLNIVATYNLLYNASLLVEEGLGYSLCFAGLINTEGSSPLCFRPLEPKLESTAFLAWKKYQVFSKAAEKFIQKLQEVLAKEMPPCRQ